jgi:diguanylate cyclase (GGDEF)-like protein
VYEASRDLGTILKVENLIERVLFISRNLYGYPSSELLLWNQTKKKLLLHGRVRNLDTVIFTEPRPVHLSSIFKAVLETGEARRNVRRGEKTGGDRRDEYRAQLVAPMIFQGKTIGILNAESPEVNAFSERDEHVFSILANSAAMAMENALLHRQMEQLTISDELTGIFNYRFFKMRLEEETKRSVRYGQPLSLIMIDIDWFKRFNDTYGHETGNRLLQGIARVITGCIRDVDIQARYGGEEFMVILPQTGQEEAYKIGERIRQQIAEARFEVGPNGEELVSVTVSVGISCYPENGRPYEELVESVDQALYRAKGAGKNLVCTV